MKKTYTKKQIREAITYWKKQLNEANPSDLQSLLAAMKAGEANFSYRKKDGSIRNARGTLIGHGKPSFFRKGYISYYDLDSDDWRMFNPDQLVDGKQMQAAMASYTPLDTASGKAKILADACLEYTNICNAINATHEQYDRRSNAIRKKYVFTSDIFSKATIKRMEWKYGASDAQNDNLEYDRMQREIDFDSVLRSLNEKLNRLRAEVKIAKSKIIDIVLKQVQPKNKDSSFQSFNYFLSIVDGVGYIIVKFIPENSQDIEKFLFRSDGVLPSFWKPGMDINQTWNNFVADVKAAGGNVQRTAKSESFDAWCRKLQK